METCCADLGRSISSDLLGAQNTGQASKQAKTCTQEEAPNRPYLNELDPLRVLTIFCIVAVHVLIYTAFLTRDPVESQVANSVYNAVCFIRLVFMFITAMALVFTYYGRPFSWRGFWKKRGVGVLLPYVIWTIVYTSINDPQPSP